MRSSPTRLLLAALAALGLLSTAAPTRASSWPSLDTPAPRTGGGEKDLALVISVEDYASLPDIPGAEANATAWVRWFAKTRGLRPDRIAHLRNNEGTPATILAKARELAERADPAGMIWVVFIGHGAPSQDQREGLLVGWAAQQTAIELYSQSLRQSELIDALGRGLKAPITLVADACFNGTARDGASIASGLQPVLLADRTALLPANVTVLSAGKSDQFAGQLPGEERPAFSYLLLGALRGWADDKTWGNGDKQVTVAEAIEFTRGALTATLKGRSQTPEATGGNPVLAKGATEPAPDLTELQLGRPATTRPAVDPTPKAALGGGAKEVGGGLDLNLDLDTLTQAQNLKDAIDRAKAIEANERATPTEKAEAWDAVASLSVKGQNPHAAEARQNAASWRAVAAKAGELRDNWAKLREALKLSVLDLGQKKELVGKLLSAYSGLSGEPAYQEAKRAKQALDGGNAFPLGGGAAAAVVGSGSSSGSAPKGYVEIPAGSFMMGSPESEADRTSDEKQRRVTITRPFWLKATEVTQGEWQAVMGSNLSHFSSCGPSCPVEQVSWEDAIAYLNKLSEREGLTSCYGSDGSFRGLRCEGYRLPTEAEWEYAARAGTTGPRHGALDSVAWYGGNSGWRTHPVGQKQVNAWGLYDMLGNVWEWVHDWYGAYGGDARDPVGPSSGVSRVRRGGSWSGEARRVRAALRVWDSPSYRYGYLGFRPARSVP